MADGDPMQRAAEKADVAFELFRLLDVPFFTFHDADVALAGETLDESIAHRETVADIFEEEMAGVKVRLL